MRPRGCGSSREAASGSQIRGMLITCEKSLDGLAEVFTQIVRTDNLQPHDRL